MAGNILSPSVEYMEESQTRPPQLERCRKLLAVTSQPTQLACERGYIRVPRLLQDPQSPSPDLGPEWCQLTRLSLYSTF